MAGDLTLNVSQAEKVTRYFARGMEDQARTIVIEEGIGLRLLYVVGRLAVLDAIAEQRWRLLSGDPEPAQPAAEVARHNPTFHRLAAVLRQVDATGNILRAFRNALGLTKEELARISGVSLRTIYRWEQSDMPLTYRALVVMRDVAG